MSERKCPRCKEVPIKSGKGHFCPNCQVWLAEKKQEGEMSERKESGEVEDRKRNEEICRIITNNVGIGDGMGIVDIPEIQFTEICKEINELIRTAEQVAYKRGVENERGRICDMIRETVIAEAMLEPGIASHKSKLRWAERGRIIAEIQSISKIREGK